MNEPTQFDAAVARDLHPAILSFDSEGRLRAAEGHVAYYGLGGLRPGTAANEIDFLAAMLPVSEPMLLPMVHTREGAPRRVLLEPAESGTRVILLDATREYELLRCLR